ncbi:glycosyltransferase family 4 protein [Nonomuraea sp. NPDC050328]|uniref:glycosyltransferase family 4 protein n=1 Tax=Nonomuraea sp. NPDC050328 TaxID=3364361 RepID=UPI00378F74E8
MRIAVVSPPWLRTPPLRYGAVETIVSSLTEGLVARGHDVTLFASGDSLTSAALRSYYPRALYETGDEQNGTLEVMHALSAYRSIEEFDLVHDHSDTVGMAIASFAGASRPVVHTMHAPSRSPWFGPVYQATGDHVHLVAISQAQIKDAPGIRYADMIHHGIPVGRFTFREEKEDYCLFVGRLSPKKGLDLAIKAARKAGRRLVIACKEIAGSIERTYFDEVIQPLLGPDVEFLGEANFEEKVDLYSRAFCTLVPTRWEEPFGLTAIESLACGTPVVGLSRGATAELIDHGRTGFLTHDPDELADHLADVPGISPAECRRVAVEQFSETMMISRYEDLYRRLI